MTWQLIWCNVRAAAELNATLQLLVIYRFFKKDLSLFLSQTCTFIGSHSSWL